MRKINKKIKKIVEREKKKHLYLGVRKLANLLKEKYAIKISKTSIHKIISSQGIKEKKGRKSYILLYGRKKTKYAGLFFLRCIDREINFFDYLTEELGLYFPKLEKEILKKIIILVSFSSFLGENLKDGIYKEGFLKLVDLYHLPNYKINYFFKNLLNYKPVISLQNFKNGLKFASTIKFYFEKEDMGYCDAKFCTFWDNPSILGDFSLGLFRAKERLEEMVKEKVIMINYTKSFDYLSPLVFKFVEGLSKGIRKIEILGEKEVLEKIETVGLRPTFFIGYYPKILSKGVSFLERNKRFKKFLWREKEAIYYAPFLTRFLQPKKNKGVILNNVLIKKKTTFSPSWGIITNKKENISYFLKKYLFFWPYLEEGFLEEIEKIHNFYFQKKEEKDIRDYFPQYLRLEKEQDFAQISHILLLIFKEKIGDLDIKNLEGEIVIGKDFYKVLLKNDFPSLKRKFNQNSFYINKKRVFWE
jgi:hypothetical protein